MVDRLPGNDVVNRTTGMLPRFTLTPQDLDLDSVGLRIFQTKPLRNHPNDRALGLSGSISPAEIDAELNPLPGVISVKDISLDIVWRVYPRCYAATDIGGVPPSTVIYDRLNRAFKAKVASMGLGEVRPRLGTRLLANPWQLQDGKWIHIGNPMEVPEAEIGRLYVDETDIQSLLVQPLCR